MRRRHESVVSAAPFSPPPAPVVPAAPISGATRSGEKPERKRRRRLGFLRFAAGLILVFFLVRAIPGDWEIGPFRIDANGSAGDSLSLYFSDDPHAPFWLLVPTFNLPPRFSPPARTAPLGRSSPWL